MDTASKSRRKSAPSFSSSLDLSRRGCPACSFSHLLNSRCAVVSSVEMLLSPRLSRNASTRRDVMR